MDFLNRPFSSPLTEPGLCPGFAFSGVPRGFPGPAYSHPPAPPPVYRRLTFLAEFPAVVGLGHEGSHWVFQRFYQNDVPGFAALIACLGNHFTESVGLCLILVLLHCPHQDVVLIITITVIVDVVRLRDDYRDGDARLGLVYLLAFPTALHWPRVSLGHLIVP